MSKRDAARTCVVTPLSKLNTTGGKCRLASQTNIKGSCYVPLLLCIPIHRKLFCPKAGGRAARGHARRYHSVCKHPVGLPILSDRRGVLEGASGLSQVVGHRFHRGK